MWSTDDWRCSQPFQVWPPWLWHSSGLGWWSQTVRKRIRKIYFLILKISFFYLEWMWTWSTRLTVMPLIMVVRRNGTLPGKDTRVAAWPLRRPQSWVHGPVLRKSCFWIGKCWSHKRALSILYFRYLAFNFYRARVGKSFRDVQGDFRELTISFWLSFWK